MGKRTTHVLLLIFHFLTRWMRRQWDPVWINSKQSRRIYRLWRRSDRLATGPFDCTSICDRGVTWRPKIHAVISSCINHLPLPVYTNTRTLLGKAGQFLFTGQRKQLTSFVVNTNLFLMYCQIDRISFAIRLHPALGSMRHLDAANPSPL